MLTLSFYSNKIDNGISCVRQAIENFQEIAITFNLVPFDGLIPEVGTISLIVVSLITKLTFSLTS